MMDKTIICKTEGCGQLLEVKIASGYKDPKNKGKKYTKCLKCDAFNWIEEEKPAQAPTTPQKPTEVREVVREPIIEPKVNSKVWEDKDLRIARESALHSATRNNQGHQVDPALIILEATEYINFIYNGLKSNEDVDDIDLPSETLEGK